MKSQSWISLMVKVKHSSMQCNAMLLGGNEFGMGIKSNFIQHLLLKTTHPCTNMSNFIQQSREVHKNSKDTSFSFNSGVNTMQYKFTSHFTSQNELNLSRISHQRTEALSFTLGFDVSHFNMIC